MCGNFHHESDDEEDVLKCSLSPDSTPRRSRNSFCRRCKDSKNPYSARGLDKFSALLSDLEEKRQKIYTQKDAQDISFVRFAFSNSNRIRPIVVKAKARKQDGKINKLGETKDKPINQNSEEVELSKEVKEKMEKKSKRKKRLAWDNWRRASFYLSIVIILILVFLTVFGRPVTILCTSLGWYLVPTIKARSPNNSTGQTRKKKVYVRK